MCLDHVDDSVKRELSSKKCWRRPKPQVVGKEVRLYLSLHCHHHNDSCIKVGSDDSHFNVSSIVKAKSQDSVHKPQPFKREDSRSGIEPRSFCLPA